ncbi:MAG: HEAT repeat domain-containing protein [Fibrella sp.]|nr:HEAT repeat domain-containing protein [Armatimonadota bacterium]
MSRLVDTVSQFRSWAGDHPKDDESWEWDYEFWPTLIKTVLDFFATRPFSSWSPEEIDSVLYVIAHDPDYMPEITPELPRAYPHLILPLTAAAIERGEAGVKSRLAFELGAVRFDDPEQERLLFVLLDDDSAGVRDSALRSLALLGHPSVEKLARESWHHPAPGQEWTRINVLLCLYNTNSPELSAYLDEAQRDGRKWLVINADFIRSGKQGKWVRPIKI